MNADDYIKFMQQLNPVDEGKILRDLLNRKDEKGDPKFSLRTLGKLIDRSHDYVFKRVKLADLPKEIGVALKLNLISLKRALLFAEIFAKQPMEVTGNWERVTYLEKTIDFLQPPEPGLLKNESTRLPSWYELLPDFPLDTLKCERRSPEVYVILADFELCMTAVTLIDEARYFKSFYLRR